MVIKWEIIIILSLLRGFYAQSCNTKDMENENGKCNMITRVEVTSSALIGYGTVFACTIKEVKKGVLTDQQVRIVVLAGSKVLESIFNAEKPGILEVGLIKKNLNEPYAIMPLNGFVDSKKTSWEIVYAKNINQ